MSADVAFFFFTPKYWYLYQLQKSSITQAPLNSVSVSENAHIFLTPDSHLIWTVEIGLWTMSVAIYWYAFV